MYMGPKVYQQCKELRAQEEDRPSHHRGDKLPETSLGEENTKESVLDSNRLKTTS